MHKAHLNADALKRLSASVKADYPHSYELVIDIETAGLNTSCAAAILSIAAVRIDTGTSSDTGGAISKEDMFYAKIHVDSYRHNDNYTISVSTMLWWKDQSEEARAAVFSSGDCYTSIRDALMAFNEWYNGRFPFSNPKVWARDPSFDCVIMKKAYDIEGIGMPWKFFNECSIRTLQHMTRGTSYGRIKAPVPHHALADAVGDAVTVRSMVRLLRDSQYKYLSDIKDQDKADATSSAAHVDRNIIAEKSFSTGEHAGGPSASAVSNTSIDEFEDCANALAASAKEFAYLLDESKSIGRRAGKEEAELRVAGGSKEPIDDLYDRNWTAKAIVQSAATDVYRVISAIKKRSAPDAAPKPAENGKDEVDGGASASDSGSTDESESESENSSSSSSDADTSDSDSDDKEASHSKKKRRNK